MLLFFFFKQKTAYEMRISDWSSDVCSSDLPVGFDERVDAAIHRCPKPLRRRCQRRAVDSWDQHISRHRSKDLFGLSRGGAEKDAIRTDWQLDEEARLIEPAFPMKG